MTAELRMSLYDKHIKHARRWKYEPLNWHTWKLKVWPMYDFDKSDVDAESDIIIYAANEATCP